jgi:GTPase SAR1 family protein
MKAILLVGACGSGKTWVMKQLLKDRTTARKKYGKIKYEKDGDTLIVGKYTGETFEGSDKLSMSVATDFKAFAEFMKANSFKAVFEGDRFMNDRFIRTFNPTIIKITDSGAAGRQRRGSRQTERHLKAIQTRVNNTEANITVKDSTAALNEIKKLL